MSDVMSGETRASDTALYKIVTNVAPQKMCSWIYVHFILESLLAGNCVFSY
jgi:hypothetical protein